MHEILADWFALTPASFAAILAMLAATYFCRAGGFWLMQHVPVTPRVRRGLSALPGSIVMATITPLALRGGWPAIIGIAVAFLTMVRLRNELVALIAGLATVAIARASGF